MRIREELLQRGGVHVKKVLVSIKNELLSEAVIRTIKECGEFVVDRISPDSAKSITQPFDLMHADIYLMEISYLPGTTLNQRLNEIHNLRSSNPECKFVILCDDTAAPEIARKVTQLKRDHVIDAFFYTSVTANYLISTLVSL